MDIREVGSGNVGTLNSYAVTRSKPVALGVLAGDLLKGALAVVLAREVLAGGFVVESVAGIGAVLGHNFPFSLRFRGGRGLAPAAGAMLVLGWPVVPVWLLLWGIAYLFLKEVNLANGAASLTSLLVFLAGPGVWISGAFGESAPAAWARAFGALLMATILVRLIGPIRDQMRGSGDRRKRNSGV